MRSEDSVNAGIVAWSADVVASKLLKSFKGQDPLISAD